MTSFLTLMYHNVLDRNSLVASDGPASRLSPSITSYFLTTDQFREQMQRVPAGQWLDPLDLPNPELWTDGAEESRPRILMTFDDGWAGSFDEAGPVLAECGARAIVFVTTGLIGRPLFATASQLRALAGDVFEIGSHTVTHPFLNELSESEIRCELMDSRHRLEDLLGRSVETLSIPNGAFDSRVGDCAAEAGYRFVFTSDRPAAGRARPGRIGRIAVRRTTTPGQFDRWLAGEIPSAWRSAALGVSRSILGPARYRRLRAACLRQKPDQEDMAGLLAAGPLAEASPS